MENIGVYKITNIINNKCYIGSSKNIKKRWYEHKRQLRKNQHHSKALQRAFNKYGEKNLVFEILCFCSVDELLILEQKYFDEINPEYIILKVAGRFDGYKHTEETKKLLSEISKNQVRVPCAEETKIKIGDANRNREFSEEHKDKLSKAHEGKQLSKDHKNNIRLTCTSEMMREKQKLSVNNRKDCIILGKDDEGNVLCEFNSLKKAYTELNICQSTLWRIIKNKRKFNNLLWEKQDSRLL
jgi:group I intron endonuclease